MALPPSGDQLEISAGGYAAVVTEGGAALRRLRAGARDLVDGFAADEPAPGGRGQWLVPWPNRLGDGRYRFADRELRLPLTEPDRRNAAHGLVRWAAWTPVEHAVDRVVLRHRLMAQPGYPWTLDLQVAYRLSGDGLEVTLRAANRSSGPAPFAAGAHPYLAVGPGPVDDLELTLPAGVRLLTDDRLLPVGREDVAGTAYDFRTPRPVGGTVLDDAFGDLSRDERGRAAVVLRDPRSGEGVLLWVDRAHRWLQVYSADDVPATARRSLAVEPMTAPPDAFRSGEDLTVLAPAGEPGDTVEASWGIRALG